jgi:hypothetical protein
MEVPAVKFSAYCLDKHTTVVKHIDELRYAVEAPAQAGNICDQNTIEGAGHLLGGFEQMHKELAPCERIDGSTDVRLHRFSRNFPALFLGHTQYTPEFALRHSNHRGDLTRNERRSRSE